MAAHAEQRRSGANRSRRASPAAHLIFASTFARDFFAVVPTSSVIPDLLVAPGWRFVRILKGGGALLPFLRRQSAIDAIKQDGYHLFADPELNSKIGNWNSKR
ncbi:hypothetical protein [Rhodopseudomonas sp. AAP120]|uniref:hypothetical protein n=1 Tax=Rhodopseudomonas sp. AAP120 TaxID=1523430 RepID=UPI001AEBD972|nr:hypothetical protein [Rhodopseudomonas sp. AAP120]